MLLKRLFANCGRPFFCARQNAQCRQPVCLRLMLYAYTTPTSSSPEPEACHVLREAYGLLIFNSGVYSAKAEEYLYGTSRETRQVVASFNVFSNSKLITHNFYRLTPIDLRLIKTAVSHIPRDCKEYIRQKTPT